VKAMGIVLLSDEWLTARLSTIRERFVPIPHMIKEPPLERDRHEEKQGSGDHLRPMLGKNPTRAGGEVNRHFNPSLDEAPLRRRRGGSVTIYFCGLARTPRCWSRGWGSTERSRESTICAQREQSVAGTLPRESGIDIEGLPRVARSALRMPVWERVRVREAVIVAATCIVWAGADAMAVPPTERLTT